jgi:polar amino acid transport system substrate-binding protein
VIEGRNFVSSISRLGGEIKRLALVMVVVAVGGTASAQAPHVSIPNFWDPRARAEKPDLTGTRTVRFLVDDEFPPLHFAGADGNPTGFSVELARAACERLAVTCTVQVRRFDTLLDALSEKTGDVVAAAIAINPGLRERFSITHPYFRIPARLATRKGRAALELPGKPLEGRSVGVVSGTAHEAFATAFFPKASIRAFPERSAAEGALKRGEVDYLFGDGLSLALWIGGSDAAECCAFVGGPYLESRFFGEGIGFIVRKEDETLRRAFDYALQRLWDDGKYAELYLRFFPVSPF